MRRASGEKELPDVLFAAYPTVDLAGAAVDFGRNARRPVIADIRDLWPDIFAGIVPAPLRPIAELALTPLKRRSRVVLGAATAITGVTKSVLQWGVARAGRAPRALDRAIPLAVEHATLTPVELEAAERSLAEKGVPAKRDKTRLVFAGTLSRQFDFEPIMLAAEALRDQPFEFIIAGTGESEQALRVRAAGLPLVTLVGWLGRTELAALLGSATLGLAPYIPTWDFELIMPNKVSEYLAWGLPVVSSLGREVATLLQAEQVGFTYTRHDSSALVRELRLLAADRQQLEAMSARARALFTARFSAEQTYVAMANYLEEVAADADSPG